MHAVALLAQREAEQAINIFLDLDVNPAKVVALYPVEVSGRLSRPQSTWIELFGEKCSQGVVSPSLLDDIDMNRSPEDVTTVVDPDTNEPSPSASVHEPEIKDDAKGKAEAASKHIFLSRSHTNASQSSIATQ